MRKLFGIFSAATIVCSLVANAATPTLEVTWPMTLNKAAEVDYSKGTGIGVFFGDGVTTVTVSVVANSGAGAETVLGTLSNPTGTNSVLEQGWIPKDKGNQPGSYKVKVTSGSLVKWSDTFTVYDSTLALSATASGPKTAVTGQVLSYSVAVAGGTGPYTFTWTGATATSDPTYALLTPATTGTVSVSVKVTSADNIAGVTSSVSTVVSAAPTTPPAPDPILTIKAGASNGFTGRDVEFLAVSIPGASYSWSGSVVSSLSTVTAQFASVGNYSATCTATYNGQTASATVTANIIAAPVAPPTVMVVNTNTTNSVVIKPHGEARVDQLMTFEVNSSSVPSSIMIDWGDGKFVSPAGTDSVGGLSYLSHTFANIGQYSINFQLVINGQTINVPETVKVSDGVLILIRRVPIAFRGIIYPVVQITDENGAELSSTTFSSLGLTPKVPNKNMSWKKASLQFTSTKFFPQPHYWGLPPNTTYWYAKH